MNVIAAFYQFAVINDVFTLKAKLFEFMNERGIKGTMILASEGINATIAGSRANISELKQLLLDDGRFNSLEYKESFSENNPFKRLKLHCKKEIVTLGMPHISGHDKGIYVEPQKWNDLIKDPSVTVLDVRNDFEVKMGTFANSLNPQTNIFSEFPAYVEKNLTIKDNPKIAMSCTGGIRCEKASAYMKTLGYEVYHLKGGILKYLEDVPKEESLWQGECFVFDERVSVDHDLKPKVYERCRTCGQPMLPACACEARV